MSDADLSDSVSLDGVQNGSSGISAHDLDKVKQVLQDIRSGVNTVKHSVLSWKERSVAVSTVQTRLQTC